MHDKKGTKGLYFSTLQNWLNIQDLLRIGLNNKTAIRSEIYLQIIKQVTNNTKSYELNFLNIFSPQLISCFCRSHVSSGWELMTYCANTFAPEDNMQKPLIGWLLEVIQTNSSKLHDNSEWAKLCLDALRKSILFGERKMLPSVQELEAIKVFLFLLFVLILNFLLI